MLRRGGTCLSGIRPLVEGGGERTKRPPAGPSGPLGLAQAASVEPRSDPDSRCKCGARNVFRRGHQVMGRAFRATLRGLLCRPWARWASACRLPFWGQIKETTVSDLSLEVSGFALNPLRFTFVRPPSGVERVFGVPLLTREKMR